MAEATIVVEHEVGLHARPASAFVKAAQAFDSTITITNLTRGSEPADAKSLVQIFKAAVGPGHEMRITAEGSDEDAAVEALVRLVASNFGE
jgi:phosphotransferase system HPr (HPr) family protein